MITTKKVVNHAMLCFSLMVAGLTSLSTIGNTQKLQQGYPAVQLPTANSQQQNSDVQQQLPRPIPRKGMSEYQSAIYSNTAMETQSDTITSHKGQGLPGAAPTQSPNRPYNGPSVTIPQTGIQAYFNAPVTPPYNAAASYDTFRGQPGGGTNAIFQQNADRN